MQVQRSEPHPLRPFCLSVYSLHTHTMILRMRRVRERIKTMIIGCQTAAALDNGQEEVKKKLQNIIISNQASRQPFLQAAYLFSIKSAETKEY